MPDIHPEVALQLADLSLIPDRPLLVSDADEVLLYFARHFRDFIGERGLVARFRDYALFGNIHHADSGEPANRELIHTLIRDFFVKKTTEQTPVPGAAEGLSILSVRAQVVILSNVPQAHRKVRHQTLEALGMDYPVIANTGLKGPVVRHLAEQVQAPVVFIDDIDRHHSSVAACASHVYRLHFIADEELAALAEPAADCHHRCDTWPEAVTCLESELARQGY